MSDFPATSISQLPMSPRPRPPPRPPLALRPPFPAGWASLPLRPADLNLANTLPVGQSFLWHRRAVPSTSGGAAAAEDEFSRAVDNPPRVVCLRQTPSALFYASVYPQQAGHAQGQAQVQAQGQAHAHAHAHAHWEADKKENTTKRWLEDYFQLNQYPDLPALYAQWSARDPRLFGTYDFGGGAAGVRVLRQDPWECLLAFITSANNNIMRITSLLHKLSERFADPLLVLADPDGTGETTHRLFPTADQIINNDNNNNDDDNNNNDEDLEATLRALGFGYRANYIAATLAYLVARGDVAAELARWRSLPLDTVRAELLALKGVGRKVADCVLLMCMDQPSVIPVDTHIYTIASRHPALPARLSKAKFAGNMYGDIQTFLAESWGPLGGWTQAVVFAAEIEQRRSRSAAAQASPKSTPKNTPKSTPRTPRKTAAQAAPNTPSKAAPDSSSCPPEPTEAKPAVKREATEPTPETRPKRACRR